MGRGAITHHDDRQRGNRRDTLDKATGAEEIFTVPAGPQSESQDLQGADRSRIRILRCKQIRSQNLVDATLLSQLQFCSSRGCLCGKRGIWTHRRAFCVVGVALGDIDLHLVWHAWHLWHWAGSGGALWLHTTCLPPSPVSFLPVPSSPFFCDLLEEVDMWGCPVL